MIKVNIGARVPWLHEASLRVVRPVCSLATVYMIKVNIGARVPWLHEASLRVVRRLVYAKG